MRLPNGYGTVYKLSGNRRNPFVARKFTGYDSVDGKTIRKYATIGYFPDRAAALQALAEYNGNPYDLSKSSLTFKDVYEMWKKEAFNDNSNKSTVKNYTAAYKRCTTLYGMKMSKIRTYHLQEILNGLSEMSYESVQRVRVLFNKMFKFCIAKDFLKVNYAENLTISVSSTPNERKAFTTEEIQQLWKHTENDYVKLVLMLIYSGVRINELLDLKKEDVHLDEQIFYVRQSKTAAGVRKVPIADKVLPFWKMFLEKSKCPYAVANIKGDHLTYDNFKRRYWYPLKEQLNFDHTIHETRHTCISQLTMKNANPTIIKHIVGHKSIMTLTEAVYTHIENKELIDTINLIP